MGIDRNSSRIGEFFFFFFFSKVHNGSCYNTARFEVEIEMRGDSVSVFRMEVTRGKEDATANYRMIIN